MIKEFHMVNTISAIKRRENLRPKVQINLLISLEENSLEENALNS